MRYVKEGWPHITDSEEIRHYMKLANSLTTENGCLLLGSRIVIPHCLREPVLHLIHLGHFEPYHHATNGVAERLRQSFKQSLRKSTLSPNAALQEFLLQYRRTPLDSGYSPSELLNGRQIRRDKQRRWVPAVVTKVFGSRSVNVRVLHGGPTWRHHIDQLRPRYGVEHDDDPGEALMSTSPIPDPKPQDGDGTASRPARRLEKRRNPRLPTPTDDHYGPDNPRRSKRLKQKTTEDEGYLPESLSSSEVSAVLITNESRT
ncbi:uncharacterized protein LOC123508175 [Portunus trituberculatus]|uniref:uncharacterized protein LOC123508175 n=1 Tax=Portunus trituberculatus TaxID=210409 RepID=UPI001E1D125E|nr:uncharacterized protein LOC123508175 [Portunus trituberculatus]